MLFQIVKDVRTLSYAYELNLKGLKTLGNHSTSTSRNKHQSLISRYL